MSLIVLQAVSLGFGTKTLFEDLNATISATDRIGLIGPNGSGKTSLLKVIARQQAPDAGQVQRSRGTRVGYLPQELEVSDTRPLLAFVRDSVPGRAQLQEDIARVERQLQECAADNERTTDLAAQLAELHEQLTHYEMHFTEHEAMRILAGLGFHSEERDRPVSELSGGWKMRAVLAALLFQRPELLLLDEPTNHLDLPSVAWFSSFLKRYRRAFILISHDREFLNEQIERVISFEPEGVRQYAGNYDAYVSQREEEETVLENKAKNLERQREHAERFVNRFRAKASKARAVQSRIKALEKMEDVSLYRRRQVMGFTFPPCERTGHEPLTTRGLRKAFGDHVVLRDVDLTVNRGDKIGIIGANGSGKTTLLKLLAGEILPDDGEIQRGHNVKVGYFAQHHAETLNKDSTIYQEVAARNRDANITRVRTLLGSLLFSGDDADKPINVLSGGERARVALARLLIDPGNVLLMDEPTNHLDLDSSESLAQSLGSYDGTLVFVSHNRSFVRRLATVIWDVTNGGVEPYPGTLDEYMSSWESSEAASAAGPEADAEAARGTQPQAASTRDAGRKRDGGRAADKERKRLEHLLRSERKKRLDPLKRRAEELEHEIGRLEALQRERSERLADPSFYADTERSAEVIKRYREDRDELERLTSQWEATQLEIDSLEEKLASQSLGSG